MRRNGQLNAKPTGRGFEDDTLIPRMMNSAKCDININIIIT